MQSIKALLIATAIILSTSYHEEVSAKDSSDGEYEEYEKAYENLIERMDKLDLSNFDQEVINSTFGITEIKETPPEFLEIDKKITELKMYGKTFALNRIKSSGIDLDKFKHLRPELGKKKILEAVKKVDFSGYMSDPGLLKLRDEIAEKIKALSDKGITYEPLEIRDPAALLQSFALKSPKTRQILKEQLIKNKDKLIQNLKSMKEPIPATQKKEK